MRPALTILAFLLASLAFAACGGDDSGDDTTTTAETVVPEATETLDDFGQRFADAGQAAAAGDCEAVDEFNDEAGFTIPCEKSGSGDYAELEVTGTADYGPAALVDFTSDAYPDGATAAVALHEDGRFRLFQSLVPSSIGLDAAQTATEPTELDQELRDETAARFVEAVRAKDCDGYFETALTPTQDKEKECEIEFDPETGIQPDLEANPDAAPVPLGGTEAFGLYSLETDEYYRALLAIRDYGPDETDPEPEGAYLITSYRSQD
jgi:hypothetical protein